MQDMDILEYNENRCVVIMNRNTEIQNDIIIENKEGYMVFKLITGTPFISFFSQLRMYYKMNIELVQGFKDRRFKRVNVVYIKSSDEIKAVLASLELVPLFGKDEIKTIEDHIWPVWNNRKFKEVENIFVKNKLNGAKSDNYKIFDRLLRESNTQ